jgi:hypothetical protein
VERRVAGPTVPHQPFGEGCRVAQPVAGLDPGEAELPSGCEGPVLTTQVVAGNGAVTDRGGKLTSQGVGITAADETGNRDLTGDLPRPPLQATGPVAEFRQIGELQRLQQDLERTRRPPGGIPIEGGETRLSEFGKVVVELVVKDQRHADLAEVLATSCQPSLLTRAGDSYEQQDRGDTDQDQDHDDLDQAETAALSPRATAMAGLRVACWTAGRGSALDGTDTRLGWSLVLPG